MAYRQRDQLHAVRLSVLSKQTLCVCVCVCVCVVIFWPSIIKHTHAHWTKTKISYMFCLPKPDVSNTYLAEDRAEFYANI